MWFSLIHIALLSTVLISVHRSFGEGAQHYIKFRNEIRAVVAVTGTTIRGNVFFTQYKTGGPVTVKGVITGLSKGKHGFHVHEKGDLSGGCATAGPHYNPHKKTHGGPTSENRHVGDLGNIEADDNGIAWISIVDNQISLSGKYNIIGRAVVVHADPDDLGLGGFSDSTTTGHAGARLGCGVITSF